MTEQRLVALEEDRRTFTLALDKGSKRLARAGIAIASIIGICQILAMTRDSLLYGALVAAAQLLWRLTH